MTNMKIGMAAALAVGAMAAALPVIAASGSQLTVDVEGVRSAKGNVVISMCREGQQFPQGCTFKVAAKAKAGSTKVSIPNVPDGTYAIALFHDEDANDQLTFIREGIGFSNIANPTPDRPEFERSQFRVQGSTTVAVKLRYFS
ncbi:DUF2141 domain-containing protein [Sandaracinobacteroides saxicola]|uniref:DUF2141 domain-containing protein n=1 Tax=Sandaracinobacteroides saxicola TaxID=2759707 RepID=A0A7G5IIU4_9SPHN|nr:DUF2141 domain-containing protein [Sandaracinobacteroides saxicola]QMW23286.1 DUF2141 domain-containing protein [Sandaracinobacteroides saxicola]